MLKLATRLAAFASLAGAMLGAASAQLVGQRLLTPQPVSFEIQVEINDLIDLRAFSDAVVMQQLENGRLRATAKGNDIHPVLQMGLTYRF